MTHTLINIFDFIFSSAIILVLFLSINRGKRYSANLLTIILTLVYFIAQWQLSTRGFNYVFKNILLLAEKSNQMGMHIYLYMNSWITVIHAVFQLIILISLFLIIRFWLEKQANKNTIKGPERINLTVPFVYALLNTSIILQAINPFIYSSDYFEASIIGSVLVIVPINFILSFVIVKRQQKINNQNISIKSALIACIIGILITILFNVLLHGLILLLLLAAFSMAGFLVYLGFVIYLSLFVFLYISYKSQQIAVRRFCKPQSELDNLVSG